MADVIRGRRRSPLERVVTEPAPGAAPLLLLALLVATLGAASALPAAAVLAPAVVGTVLAGLWGGRLMQVVLPLALAVASLAQVDRLAEGVPPARPQLLSAVVLALALLVTTRLVARSAKLASDAQVQALRTTRAREEDRRAAAQAQQELTASAEHWSTHDALTGLPDRTAFARTLDGAVTAGQPCALLVLELAGFSDVNASHGDERGDAVLVELAARLRTTGVAGEEVARLGGDVFGLLLRGLTEPQAGAASVRVVEHLANPGLLGDHAGELRLRAAVAVVAGDEGVSGRSLLRTAESAARRATPGRPPVVVPGAEPVRPADSHLTESDLARGLHADELFLLYQPLVSATTGRITNVEALVRWQHPEHGLVPPDAFIGLAERTGLIVPLGLRVLELACTQLRAWGQVAPGLTVAVNVSARQLAEPGFVEDVRRLLWSSQVDPKRLVLELTESLVVDDSDAAAAVLWELRGLGVRLALDDFGTGYSSLGRLGDLPLDEIKIDKSFVDRLGAQPQDSATLVTAAVAMGHGLGLEVVAEGVETMEQALFLRDVGCDLLQGYLLGKPQPADAVAAQLGDQLLPPHGVVGAAELVPAPRAHEEPTYVPRVAPSMERPRR